MPIHKLPSSMPIKIKKEILPPEGMQFTLENWAFKIVYCNYGRMRFTAECVGLIEQEPQEPQDQPGEPETPNPNPAEAEKPANVTLDIKSGVIQVPVSKFGG